MAAPLDPGYLNTQKNAAKSQLQLGNVQSALQYYRQCLESESGVCLDRRRVIDAANGLQKAQKVIDCMDRSAKLLGEETNEAGVDALEIIMEAMSISLYSEKLLQMKAKALCLMGKYEEVIQLCVETLTSDEHNFIFDNKSKKMNDHEFERDSIGKYWRSCLISKSNFYMGKLDEASELLQNLEKAGFIKDKCGIKILESSFLLSITIRKLLRSKNAGNEAFNSKQYAKAVEHYTAALSTNVESRPFAAVCLCNRAAAYHALEQYADAIADCSLAMALDANYAKAVSRRATLHETIRDYQQAACDLQTLISILEKQCDEKTTNLSDTSSKFNDRQKQLKQARKHMHLMEEADTTDIPLDLYLILGVRKSDPTSKIKKAYRSAALRHHPDKAGQFLTKSEGGKLWKEIAQKIRNDADGLFKMITKAHSVLSDSNEQLEKPIGLTALLNSGPNI